MAAYDCTVGDILACGTVPDVDFPDLDVDPPSLAVESRIPGNCIDLCRCHRRIAVGVRRVNQCGPICGHCADRRWRRAIASIESLERYAVGPRKSPDNDDAARP